MPWDPRSHTVQLHTTSRTLLTGDYVLSEAPTAGCVERKAHLSELHTNLFTENGYRKFSAEMDRLRSTFSHPLVVVEGNPCKPLPVRPGLAPGPLILDALLALTSRYNVPVLFLDGSTVEARRNVGEIVARHLLHAAYPGASPCSSKPCSETSPPPP